MIREHVTDGMILEFVGKHGFITIKQCGKVFYKRNKRAYECARLKLKRLLKFNMVKEVKYLLTGEYAYQLKGDTKNISDSRMVTLNLFAEINSLVDEVNHFKLEEEWGATKKRSDGHIVFTVNKGKNNEYMRAYCIEVENYYKLNIDKYDDLYESNVIQNWYKEKFSAEWFPDVIIVSPTLRTVKPHEHDYKVINLDYSMEGILQKVIL